MVKAFQESLAGFKVAGKVFATDMRPNLSPACEVAERSFEVPAATDAGYVEFLLALCKAEDVALVIPTIDTELLLLAENSELFCNAGIQVVVSDLPFIEACRDKRQTGDLFIAHGIGYPEIYPKDDLKFPCFCKPYDGSSSIGAKIIDKASEITAADFNNPKNIFMEFVPKSYCEYTVDGYYSQKGELRSLVCRERIEVRSGEVSKGITRKDFVYDYLVHKLSTLPGARGCITFQFFVNKSLSDIKGLEINPRFGGGYPLTHKSGAKYTDYLISEYFLGKDISFYDQWESELLMLRYDSGVYKKYAG